MTFEGGSQSQREKLICICMCILYSLKVAIRVIKQDYYTGLLYIGLLRRVIIYRVTLAGGRQAQREKQLLYIGLLYIGLLYRVTLAGGRQAQRH